MKKALSFLATACVALSLSACERENEVTPDPDFEPAIRGGEIREDLNTQPADQTIPGAGGIATPDRPNPELPGEATDLPGIPGDGSTGSGLPGGDEPLSSPDLTIPDNDTAVPDAEMNEEP